jgi:hypothetical protein
MEVAVVGIEQLYKTVPIGTSAEAITAVGFTGRGVALKPFSPVHVEATRDDDGNITITWVRRDRLGTDVVIPMSESVLDFEVDVLGADGAVLRTISVSAETAGYSVDQQLTDFSELQLEGTLEVRVYQISVLVGRGTAAEATL